MKLTIFLDGNYDYNNPFMKPMSSTIHNSIQSSQKIDRACYETEFYQKQIKIEKSHFWFQHRNKVILNALREVQALLGAELVDMIEIGCGIGTVTAFLIQSGFQVSGADLYPEGLEECQKRLHTTLYQFDVRNIPYENKWNVIGCFDVLEHIEEEEVALRSIHGALTARGRVILTVPAVPFLYSIHEGTHKRRYSKNDLINKLTRSGFAIEKISYFFSFLFPIFAASRILKKMKNENVFESSDFDIHPLLNQLFLALCNLEGNISKVVPALIGSSLIVIARKVS